MRIDFVHILGRTFSMTWRHKWLWLLGVFGGGGGIGFRGNFSVPSNNSSGGLPFTQDHLNAFLAAWWWLIVVAVAVLLLIGLAGFIIGCIAIPAATWAALALDAGDPASLGTAWRQGVRRFWVYLRLNLLRLAISLGLLAVVLLLVLIGVLVLRAAGPSSLWVLVPLGILLLLALVIVSLVLAFLFAWSDRTPILLGVGAVEALRSSAHLARRAWGETLLFAILMGVIATVVGIGVALGAGIVAIPGIIISLAGLGASSSLMIGVGIVWVVVIGGAVLVVGGGFVGSLVQVGYALACRDLCANMGIAIDPGAPVPGPLPALAPPASAPA